MKPTFWGYSVYEVDRVFCASAGTRATPDVERVQVIRVMFRTDIEDIQKDLGAEGIVRPIEKIKIIVHDLHHSNKRELKSPPRKNEASIVRRYLEGWRWDIRLFLFGYVIRGICNEIKETRRKDKTRRRDMGSVFLGHQNQSNSFS